MSYILIAEDDRDILLIIERRLSLAGYTPIWSTGNGREALEKALSEPPRLMILDIMLPELTGLEICRQTKEAFGEQAPKVIITSARGRPTDFQEAYDVGADQYVVKPFSPRQLLDHVKEQIG